MPIFKPKNTKKIFVSNNSIVTLDSKHSELIKQFDDESKINIPNLKKEKKEITQILKNDELPLEKRLDYKDKIKIINEQIKEIKQKKKKYYLDNSKYIFDYFENKKLVEDGKNKVKKLDSFFNIKKNDESYDLSNENINNSVQKYLYNVDEVFFDIVIKEN